MASPYLLAMGLSFSCGITIVTLTARMRISMASLETPAGKAYLASHVHGLVTVLYIMYVSSFVLFFAGFGLMGFVKPGFGTPWPARFTLPIACSGAVAVVITLYLTLARQTIPDEKAFADDTAHLRLCAQELAATDYYTEWKELLSMQNGMFAGQATFVAGNSFFEVLFSDADVSTLDKTLASWGYVLSNVVACTFGFLIVCWTTQIQRAISNSRIYSIRDESSIFQCWLIMTFSWTFSLLCLDEAKFPQAMWGTTFGWGCFALVALLVVLYTVRGVRTTVRMLLEDASLMLDFAS